MDGSRRGPDSHAPPIDEYDLTDLLTAAAKPTSHLITVTVNPDGSVSFALPRAEVGQGITTAVAMTIPDEMDLPIEKVNITLADARPELIWNQLTGGSNSMHSIFTPVRVAAAIARGQLLQAAAGARRRHERPDRRERSGQVSERTLGDLRLADKQSRGIQDHQGHRPPEAAVALPADRDAPPTDRRSTSSPAASQFALDLDVPGALPTMVCRPADDQRHGPSR